MGFIVLSGVMKIHQAIKCPIEKVRMEKKLGDLEGPFCFSVFFSEARFVLSSNYLALTS